MLLVLVVDRYWWWWCLFVEHCVVDFVGVGAADVHVEDAATGEAMIAAAALLPALVLEVGGPWRSPDGRQQPGRRMLVMRRRAS